MHTQKKILSKEQNNKRDASNLDKQEKKSAMEDKFISHDIQEISKNKLQTGQWIKFTIASEPEFFSAAQKRIYQYDRYYLVLDRDTFNINGPQYFLLSSDGEIYGFDAFDGEMNFANKNDGRLEFVHWPDYQFNLEIFAYSDKKIETILNEEKRLLLYEIALEFLSRAKGLNDVQWIRNNIEVKLQKLTIKKKVDQRDFREIVTTQTYVDKSLLIKNFFENDNYKEMVFLYPRCGKSVNLSMLRYFFSAKVNGCDTRPLFEDLQINHHPEIMTKQGKYCVIYIDLNDLKPDNSFSEIEEMLKNKVSVLYKEYAYLLDSEYLNKNIQSGLFSKYNLKNSIQKLAKAISEHNKAMGIEWEYQRPMILIDGYDSFIEHQKSDNNREEILSLLRNFLFLKSSCEHFNCAIMTGHKNIGVLDNNTTYFKITNSLFSSYFGLTVNEKFMLLNRFQLNADSDQITSNFSFYNEIYAFNEKEKRKLISEGYTLHKDQYYRKEVREAYNPETVILHIIKMRNLVKKDSVNSSELQPSIIKLPIPALKNITLFLQPKELYRLAQTCKTAAKIVGRKPDVSTGIKLGKQLIDAAYQGKLELVNDLLHQHVDINLTHQKKSPLESAIRYGQIHVVKLLLQWGANIHFRAEYDRMALMIAVMGKNENHVNIAHLLIEKKIDINATDEDKKTALMYAIQHNNLSSVKLLISAGAAINIADKNGDTPLHYAALRDEAFLDCLIKAGANPTVVNLDGKSPLQRTSEYQKNVQLLIEAGADQNELYQEGKTELMYAVEWKDFYRVVDLIKQGANPNEQDHSGTTALMIAAKHADMVLVSYLVSIGANINIQNNSGQSAAFFASRKTDIIIFLIEAGANIDIISRNGETLLMNAVAAQDLITIQALLEKGISEKVINMQAKGCFDTETPLGFATRNLNSPHGGKKYTTIMMMLLRAGADPTIESDGVKPLDVLSNRRLKNKELNKLLTKFEQDNNSSLSYNSLSYK